MASSTKPCVCDRAQTILDRLDLRADSQSMRRLADRQPLPMMLDSYTNRAAYLERSIDRARAAFTGSAQPSVEEHARMRYLIGAIRQARMALVEHEHARLAMLQPVAPGDCLCPLVWNGHGLAKPDPKRIDPDCTVHGGEP